MRDNVGDMYPTIKMKKVRGLCPLTTSFRKEVSAMKLINPVGRNVSFNADDEINPNACMCRNGIAFSAALGDYDNCSHCGCNCWPWNHGSNSTTAANTNRTSL